MTMVCTQARPPGARQRFSVAKYEGQYASPTASNISIEAIASYWPSFLAVVLQAQVPPCAGPRVRRARA